MSAGCTRLQQRNNNEPATIPPAAEAELTTMAPPSQDLVALNVYMLGLKVDSFDLRLFTAVALRGS
jgi:hypothetical protein